MTTKQGIARVLHGITRTLRDERASDRELLRRFVERRDQDAFVELVRRHGALVLGVGWRVLGRRQDAEDVCQATFLILAQKARTTAWHESVANWLYDVAHRLARKARKAAERRRARERQAGPRPAPDALADITLRDLQTILDEELARLPQRLRAPLVLCCLEGKTRDEAARCLAVPLATVVSRLVEGRERLRRRLARRGVPLAAAGAGLTLLAAPADAALPAPLVAATTRAALEILAGHLEAGAVAAPVAALVKGGMHAMLLMKAKTVAAVVVATCLLAAGATALCQRAPSQAPVAPAAPAPGPEVAAPAAVGDQKAAGPKKTALDRALQLAKDLDPKESRWPEEKVRLLATIAAAQARAGDRAAADKTFQLALDLVKDVENEIHRCAALGAIALHQLQVDDIKGARKTLAVLEALKEKSTDDNVLLNATNNVNGTLAGIAQAEARAGDFKAALKTARALDSAGHRTVVFAVVAREQAKRKDVAGALATVGQIDSDLVRTQILVDVAKIQEGTDKAGAAQTWKLALARLRKLDFLEPDDLVPGRSRLNFHAVIPALAERGHGDALLEWVDGLRSAEVKVKLLLILAGGQ
jgi:RNA polymerase sigma factor (sigma-70 family)